MIRRRLLVVAGVVLAFGAPCRPVAAQAPTDRAVRVNDISVSYRVQGEGEPLLLLHYFGGCGAVWEPFIEALSERYRLIIPDMRGHGRSTENGGAFTHRQSADDMLALLDSLGIDRVRAIGMSSGGMTLLHMATRAPDRIEAMILVGATTYFGDPARRIMEASHPDVMAAEDVAQWGQCSARGDDQTRSILLQFHGMKDSYEDMDFTGPRLSTVRARTLVVHGDRDEFFPVGIAVGMYESIPESALWIVPNGGHIPIFGPRAAPFLDVTLDFLGG